MLLKNLYQFRTKDFMHCDKISIFAYLINNKYTEKLITDYDKDEHTHDYVDRLISKGKIKNIATRDEYENCLKEIYQNFVKAV